MPGHVPVRVSVYSPIAALSTLPVVAAGALAADAAHSTIELRTATNLLCP